MTAIASKSKDKKRDPAKQAMDRALKYLSYRPRSAAEIKNRLKQDGHQGAVISETLKRLKRTGLIDDTSFATQWKQSRQNNSPRSARLLAHELRQKGIDGQTIEVAIADIDDEAEAYRAATKKASSLREKNIHEFRRKLSAFLRNRGFGYEVSQTVTEKLWHDNFRGGLDE